jgi:hypothetical protein
MQKEIYLDFKTMNDPLEWVRVGLIAVPKNNYFFLQVKAQSEGNNNNVIF